ncbi:MAG: hypothetical protein ABMA15_02915 [Vicinamibacterales bacterium]
MSLTDSFLTMVQATDWDHSFSALNGMSMTDMLRALGRLSRPQLEAAVRNRSSYGGRYNMARIEYAMFVVQTGSLPSVAPGDLESTGQVQEARQFLRLPSGEDSYVGTEPAVDLHLHQPVSPDTFFSVAHPGIRPSAKPVYDEASHAVVGYVYESQGYFEYYDLDGNRVATDEIGLEQPLLDPIDLLFIGGGLVRGISKGIVRGGATVAARTGARMTLRALTTAVITAMRASFKSLISTRTLRFTATTAARMASKERHVPVHILQLAIKFGKREADPKKIAGLFRYTIRMFRNGRPYTLEIVVREKDWTVMHFLYK